MTNLTKRINDVMSAVKALEADKTHQQGYSYISADKILARIGAEMAANGLSIVPGCVGHTTTMHEVEKYNKTQVIWQVDAQLEMTVSDVDGNKMTTSWTGSGVDYATPDKALYKAITSGHKYFVMKLFMVGVGNEDGEHEDHPPVSRANPSRNSNGNGVSDSQRKPTPEQMKAFHAAGAAVYGDDWDEKRKEIVGAVTKGRTESSKQITLAEYEKLMRGIQAKADTA